MLLCCCGLKKEGEREKDRRMGHIRRLRDAVCRPKRGLLLTCGKTGMGKEANTGRERERPLWLLMRCSHRMQSCFCWDESALFAECMLRGRAIVVIGASSSCCSIVCASATTTHINPSHQSCAHARMMREGAHLVEQSVCGGTVHLSGLDTTSDPEAISYVVRT